MRTPLINFFFGGRNKCRIPPPPPPPLSDFFKAGAASLPASDCKTPPLEKSRVYATVHHDIDSRQESTSDCYWPTMNEIFKITILSQNQVNNSLHLWSEEISFVEEWIICEFHSILTPVERNPVTTQRVESRPVHSIFTPKEVVSDK